jgi:AraC-like DNA-binding protein
MTVTTAKTGQGDEVVVDTSDPDQAEAFAAQVYGHNARYSPGDLDWFHFRIARSGPGPFHFSTVAATTTLDHYSEPLPAADLLIVRMHHGVRTNVGLDDHCGPGEVTLQTNPGWPFHIRLTSTNFTAVSFPIQATAEAARNRPDDALGPRHFHSLRPGDPAASRRWLQTVDYISQSLRDYPEAMAHPLISGAATRLLAATLLATFPNTWITEPHYQDRTDDTPTTLTRAIAFIEANAHIDISVTDIARAAYVTVRAVQLAFRRQLNTTPLAYLRRARLDRAHEELRDADPGDGTTIAQTAARWGFADPSRFTALYRATYGQLPRQTLHE